MFKLTLENATLGTLILENEAIGWDKSGVNLKRNAEWLGVFNEYASSLEFINQARDFIIQVYESEGIEGKASLKIEVLDSSNIYHLFFEGNLNLSRLQKSNLIDNQEYFSDSKSKFLTCKVPIDPTGLYITLKNRKSIKIDFANPNDLGGAALSDMTGFAPYNIALHSKQINRSTRWTDASVFNLAIQKAGDFDGAGLFCNPVNNVVFDENSALQYVVIEEQEVEASFANISPVFIAPKTGSYKLRLVGDFSGSYNAIDSDGTLTFDYTTDLSVTHITVATLPIDNNTSGNFSIPINYELVINLQENEKFYLFYFLSAAAQNVDGDIDVSLGIDAFSYAELINFSTLPDSQADVWLVHEALATVLESVLEKRNILKSDFFGRTDSLPRVYPQNGCGYGNVITNGLKIRNFSDAKSPTINFNDLFSSLDAIYNLGLGIEDVGGIETVVIEPKIDFFLDEVIFTFDFVPEIDVNIANEFYQNKIVIGYQEYANEGINTIDEFCTKQERRNYLTTTDKQKRILSKLVASGYAIEDSRRLQYSDSPTEGNQWDNKNFVIGVHKSGNDYLTNKNENFTNVQNVISPETSYNLDKTPLRNFANWSYFLNSSLYKKEADKWFFASGEGNTELLTNKLDCGTADVDLIEKQDIDNTILNNCIFIPEWIRFEVSFTIEQYLELKSARNRYKKIRISDKLSNYSDFALDAPEANYFEGWIFELNYLPYQGKAKFKLLRARVRDVVLPVPPIDPPVIPEEVTLPPFVGNCSNVNYDASPLTHVAVDMSAFTGYGSLDINYNILSGTIDFEVFALIGGNWVSVTVQNGINGNGIFIAPYNGEPEFRIEMTKNNAPAGLLTICVTIA